MLTYKTAGESHSKGLAALIEGFPAGCAVPTDVIDAELARRQGGYGRGARQRIERDRVEILSGVLHGKTTGAPLLLWIKNRDEKIESMPELTRPRPGHADFTGAMKYANGIRGVLERASARETAARVAAGAFCSGLLATFGIFAAGYVTGIGPLDLAPDAGLFAKTSCKKIIALRNQSSVYSLCPERDALAERLIDSTGDEGDTLGGVIEVRVFGVPVGLGSHTQYDLKLDAKLAAAAMSIQAMKGVEIGLGFEAARRVGSLVHDPILPRRAASKGSRITRPTNHAGGIEGGMSNGEPIIVRAAMKPIATLKKPLASVDLATGKKAEASFERSDVCAVSAASVVLQNVVAFEIASALLEKLGADSLAEAKARFELLQKTQESF